MGDGPLGFALDADAGERLVFGDVTVLIRASAETTCGAFTLIEEIPPMVDLRFTSTQENTECSMCSRASMSSSAATRSSALALGVLPCGSPYSQLRVVPGEGRLLVPTSPAAVEGFFRQLAAARREGTLGPDAYAEASERYGITWLG